MAERPLFEGMDEQERAFAPQQVPDAEASRPAEASEREAGRGTEGRTPPPTVPAQPTIGAVGTTTVPPTAAPDLEQQRDEPAG